MRKFIGTNGVLTVGADTRHAVSVIAVAFALALSVILPPAASSKDVRLRDPQRTVAELPINVTAGHSVAAPVYINGKGPLDFIVDTGATTSGIWQSSVMQNGLRNRLVETVSVSAADGVVDLRILEFSEFRAAVFALTPPRLMEYPDYYSYYKRPLEGILGADYLMNHVVVFDFPRDMMVLYPKKTNLMRTMRGYFDAIPLDFTEQQKALFVNVKVGDQPVRALVDTGAAVTTILASEALRLGVSLIGARQVILTGVNENPVTGYIVVVPQLRAGSRVWKDVEVVFAQFTVARSDGFSMLLGMDLLGQTPFAIDYGRERLLLAKPEKVKMVSIRDPRSQAIVERPEELECSFPSAAREGLPCVVAAPRPEPR